MAAKKPSTPISAPDRAIEARGKSSIGSLVGESTVIEFLRDWIPTIRAGGDTHHYTARALLFLNGVDRAYANEYVRSLLRRPSSYRLSIRRIQPGRDVIAESRNSAGVACWIVIPFSKKRSEIIADFSAALDDMLRTDASAGAMRYRDVKRVARDLMAFTLRSMPIHLFDKLLEELWLPPLTKSKTTDPKTARRNAALRGKRIVQDAGKWPGSRVILAECAEFRLSTTAENAAVEWKSATKVSRKSSRRSAFELRGFPQAVEHPIMTLNRWAKIRNRPRESMVDFRKIYLNSGTTKKCS